MILSLIPLNKGYILGFLALTLCSCQSLSQLSEGSQINETTSASANSDSPECLDTPSGSLTNPKLIDLEGQTVQKTGRIQSGDDLGFIFQGQKGQKINYRYNDDLCVWIYTPDNSILSGVELPVDGTYTVHLASLTGTTTFDIKLSLSNPISATSQTASSTPSSNSNSQTSTNIQSPPTNVQSSARHNLSQDKAIKLVSNWLNSKDQVFAHPFSVEPVRRYTYTSGPLHRDITKPGGSIDWLRNNNSYYQYQASRITKVISFSTSGSQPELVVSIYEDRTLQTPNGIDRSASGSSTRSYSYSFIKENGRWKIFDYRGAN